MIWTKNTNRILRNATSSVKLAAVLLSSIQPSDDPENIKETSLDNLLKVVTVFANQITSPIKIAYLIGLIATPFSLLLDEKNAPKYGDKLTKKVKKKRQNLNLFL